MLLPMHLWLALMKLYVFVCAMQRVMYKPKIIHVKRLNAVLRWMQANPKRLSLRPATGPSHLRCVADAFKKEIEAGHSLRGALFLRSFSDTNHGARILKLLIISVVNKLLLIIAVPLSSHNHVRYTLATLSAKQNVM